MNGTDWMDSVALTRNLLADKHCNTVSFFNWLHLLNWLDSYYCIANLHRTMLCHVFNCILSNYEWQITNYLFLCEHFSQRDPTLNSHTTSQHCCLLFFPLLNETLRLLFCAFQLRSILEEKALMTQKNIVPFSISW